MNIFKIKKFRIVTVLISIHLLVSVMLVNKVQAAGLPFGGLEVFMLPCTCTGGAFQWHVFAPLFLGGAPTVGALAAPSTPLTYMYYYLKIKSWALGFYTPGAGSVCLFGVTPYCWVLPNEGLILPNTGTSPA